ncbi:energy-coupling factor transporter transmembrane protein EcfT [Geomonas sp. Red32]|uniref:energy-coupling factor transporter transmembrane component T family protein n=1 Tax=Geomonas sp. Red32 TaxID=2912856 RepID=UPI00202CE821|nr:energy-coupling factor transporter transmembrane component T [Geomonas sp. Red32]MCM0080447.1 energy-coupling factor transporter transmembrane protein EcfT [Geomonas sp. Red32]
MRAAEMNIRRFRTSDYACQFMTHDSPIHRLGPGTKLAAGTALSACAIAVRTPEQLLVLLAVALGCFFLARLTPYDLWRDTRVLVFLGVAVTAAYCALHGASDFWPGVRTSTQIILFYLPGAVFLRTTRTSEVMTGFSRVIPYRISFLLFVSVRFVPFFLRELEEISAAQRLRGAKIRLRDQADPRNWCDLFHCLVVPLMVRALKTAEELSRSAESRGFGECEQRSYAGIAGLRVAAKR